MRLNRLIAAQPGMSRRSADTAIRAGRVRLNGQVAQLGLVLHPTDHVTLDGRPALMAANMTIELHKPVGYVCSRNGQGAPTIYDLLPNNFSDLKCIGRLDKDSSGLLLLTNDGQLINQLGHPSFGKIKTYRVGLSAALTAADRERLERGISLPDGLSRLQISGRGANLTVSLTAGRNRQIRRTFAVLGYEVKQLQRTAFDRWQLGDLPPGQWRELSESVV